jgi:hypothetical protein
VIRGFKSDRNRRQGDNVVRFILGGRGISTGKILFISPHPKTNMTWLTCPTSIFSTGTSSRSVAFRVGSYFILSLSIAFDLGRCSWFVLWVIVKAWTILVCVVCGGAKRRWRET